MTSDSAVDVHDWMHRYLAAWRSDDRDAVAALFTPDAKYFTRPHRAPIEPRAAIVEWWVSEDEPSEPRFDWKPVVVTADTAIVQGRTEYPGWHTFRNLWVIRFGHRGLASEFTEWWMIEGADEDE